MLALQRLTWSVVDTTKRGLFVASLVLLTAAAADAQSSHTSPQNDRATSTSVEAGFRLGEAAAQAFGFTVFQHAVRLREQKTRRELGGEFFQEWFKSVSNAGRNWDDGGKLFTNYVAHPQGGAVYAHIYRQNDRRRRRLEIGEPGYGAMVARAMVFSAAVSTQFEIGPVSEASIGNVGMRNPSKMAWVDLVITPVLGTAWMVGEDLLDQRILRRLDGTNTVVRNTLRSVLNPARTGANLSRRKWPWFRDRDG